MKKHITLLGALLIGGVAYSQVGINTETPKATFDVTATPADLTKTDGFIAPRLKGSELKAKDANYAAPQTGAIVYVTEVLAAANTTAKTVNVTTLGYFYFDGTIWQKMTGSGGASGIEPWNLAGTTTPATLNTQDIYQTGNIGINTINPKSRLHIVDDINLDNNYITAHLAPTNLLAGKINNTSLTPLFATVYPFFNDKNLLTINSGSTALGPVYGGDQQVIVNAGAPATGSMYGVFGGVTDNSANRRALTTGGRFNTIINGAIPGTADDHVHGSDNVVTLSPTGGNLTTAWVYGDYATANANAINGSISTSGLRAVSAYANATATGNTFTTGDMFGGHLVTRPTANPGGTINIGAQWGLFGSAEPTAAGGTITIGKAAGIRAGIKLAQSAGGTLNITDLYGLVVDNTYTSQTGTANITNAYGVYIPSFKFTGGNDAKSYNLYSEGATTKNYFAGRVGIGETAPTNSLHVKATTDPVRLEGLQTGTATDNIVVADATGVLKTIAPSSLSSLAVEPWQVQGGTVKATTNTQDIYQTGNIAVGKTTGASSLDILGSFRSGNTHSGSVGTYSSILGGNTNQATAVNSIILGGVNNISSGANAVAGGNNNQSLGYASFAFGSDLVAGAAKQFSIGSFNAITTGTITNSDIATDALFQIGNGTSNAAKSNAVTVLKNGNTGIGIAGTEAAAKPTERLDIGSGNVRIRDINSNAGVGGTDRMVVADANGVLKTLDQGVYTLFHARLAANQSHTAGTLTTLVYATPLATSALYGYNTSTGTITFNQPGNYLVTMQASFINLAQGSQMLMGIRPVPDANYVARGSRYNAVATGANIGELMNYSTMIVVPTAGYQIRFTIGNTDNCTVIATETGATGSGNVTNVTIQKI